MRIHIREQIPGVFQATKAFPERLKAAAALWKIVRESDMKKEYSHDLLEKHKNDIGQVNC